MFVVGRGVYVAMIVLLWARRDPQHSGSAAWISGVVGAIILGLVWWMFSILPPPHIIEINAPNGVIHLPDSSSLMRAQLRFDMLMGFLFVGLCLFFGWRWIQFKEAVRIMNEETLLDDSEIRYDDTPTSASDRPNAPTRSAPNVMPGSSVMPSSTDQ